MQLITRAAATASSSMSSLPCHGPGSAAAAAGGADSSTGIFAVAAVAAQAPGKKSMVVMALKVGTAFVVINGLACAIGLLALVLAVVLCLKDDSSAFAATISEWLYP